MRLTTRIVCLFAAILYGAPILSSQAAWNRVALLHAAEAAQAAKDATMKKDRKIAAAAKESEMTHAQRTVKVLQELQPGDLAQAFAGAALTTAEMRFTEMQFVQTVVDSRVDQQMVAGSAAGGTGDPVEMPGLPDLLAHAISSVP